MTVEELKEEAKKHGYYLLKPTPTNKYVKLLPCTCGYKHRERVYDDNNYIAFRCKKCGKQSDFKRVISWAVEAWNEMIKNEV